MLESLSDRDSPGPGILRKLWAELLEERFGYSICLLSFISPVFPQHSLTVLSPQPSHRLAIYRFSYRR